MGVKAEPSGWPPASHDSASGRGPTAPAGSWPAAPSHKSQASTVSGVCRFQQTMKKWLRAQPDQPTSRPADQPTSIDDLQALLDAFVEEYNDHRPHRSLEHRATPATVYTTRPKATPSNGDRDDDTHDRVRRDRVDKSGKVTLRYRGRLYSIGIGRTHARTRVIILVQDLQIRIVDAATGELLRELTLDPNKRYQPIN
ncbi:integrase core domain-containing protein [Nocardioides sp. LS1]|uniref:integrase core domain-containing protein n=1 Tax=Nocardioides sp. LS1 TaxID=1027620 RepID=UPI0021AB89BF|nr:integrase core domain-containing protein [Nocardioides sp. LS1]